MSVPKSLHKLLPPYKSVSVGGRIVKEHIAVAEAALGRKLPKGAVVHHVDGNGWRNHGSNLVICPSQQYHFMLHVRQRAWEATGDPNKLPCHSCKGWGDPGEMLFREGRVGQRHKKCPQGAFAKKGK